MGRANRRQGLTPPRSAQRLPGVRHQRQRLAAAQAALSEIRTRLGQATVRAPVSGLIASRSVTRGQIIGAGTELFRIVRDGRLELDARVPEAELLLVRPGAPATIVGDQSGRTTGTVRIVTPEVDPQTRLGVARIALAPAGRCTAPSTAQRSPCPADGAHSSAGFGGLRGRAQRGRAGGRQAAACVRREAGAAARAGVTLTADRCRR